MEPPKRLNRSRIVVATTETYRELISAAGNTLVMYDVGTSRYRNDQKIRQAFRNIAKEYTSGQLHVVLVDLDQCKTGTDKTDWNPTFRLLRDGQEISLLTMGYGKAERLGAWVWEQIGPPPTRKDDVRFQKCDLRHGVQLVVRNTSGQLSVNHVADFLASAMGHFKHERDVLKTGLYAGRTYCHEIRQGRRALGTTELVCTNAEGLTAALWTDAVIHAYTNANTVEQMVEELPEWRKAVEGQNGHVREVVGMLDKPGGDLLGMEAMLKRDSEMGR